MEWSANIVRSNTREYGPALDVPDDEREESAGQNDFLKDVLEGLSRPAKALPAKYFYDRRGSEYFDRICELEEYYPYRAELSILPQAAKEVAELLRGSYSLIEFGAGSLRKVQPLLEAADAIHRFMPIDISGEHLERACGRLRQRYPELEVQAIVRDFCQPVALPEESEPRLGFFPGSTIGNFSPAEARDFLRNAGGILGRKSYLLIGVDTKKSPHILHRAYNDSEGITAAFNRNILARINRELDTNLDLQHFEHYAFYNPRKGRVEMHLISQIEQRACIGGLPLHFGAGESIHTENSYKYSPGEFKQLARSAGWQPQRQWLAADNLFALYLLRNGGN